MIPMSSRATTTPTTSTNMMIVCCSVKCANFPNFKLVSQFLLFYATADEADAYMFYRCFLFFFCFFPFATKIPDNHFQERLNGFS